MEKCCIVNEKGVYMISRLNPWEIVESHFLTFYDFNNNKICRFEIFCQFAIACIFACVHVKWFTVDSTDVGIVVSVAAIVAGLLLNVMVLIYTLLTSKIQDESLAAGTAVIVRKIGKETLSNIAFSVLVSILLVIFALFNLTTNQIMKCIGQFFMVFFGTFLVITIMIILVRFYRLMDFNFKSIK